jgi:hypothetical protein
MTNAPWYVFNQTLHDDLKIPYIKEVIHSQATKYRNRYKNHKNQLINPLISDQTAPRRLKRQWPEDLVR